LHTEPSERLRERDIGEMAIRERDIRERDTLERNIGETIATS
jgi:hypothetical protein